MPAEPLRAQRIEQVIRAYIKACNEADAARIAACFHPDAVHYFPHFAKWSGASTIGGNFASRARERGLYWTIDQVIVDGSRSSAALEWTQFDRQGRILRGVDWFVFEPETLHIQEIRPYTAARLDFEVDRQELREFDYAERGYPTARPVSDGKSGEGTKR
jgi:methyltransferase